MTPKTVYFGMLGLVAVVVLAGAGAFYVVDGQLTAKAMDVSSLKADLDIIDIKTRNTKAIVEELKKFQDLEKIVDEVLPPKKIQDDLLAEILLFADDNNATIGPITFPSSGESKDFDKSQTAPFKSVPGVLALSITAEFTATFDDMLTLLEDLEQNQRKMQIVSVDIKPEADDNNNPTGKYILLTSINVYQRAQ